MAGENIIPLTRKGIVSVDVTADKAYAKGDLYVYLRPDANGPDIHAFALHAAAKDERMAVCLSCDLVEINNPASARAGDVPALKQVICDKNKAFVITEASRDAFARRGGANALVGFVHHDHPTGATRLQVVWRVLA